MNRRKFIPLSLVDKNPSDKSLHKYVTYIPDIENTVIKSNTTSQKCPTKIDDLYSQNVDTSCSQDPTKSKSIEFFTKTFLNEQIAFPLIRRAASRKIRQKRPKSFTIDFKNVDNYREKCLKNALQKFEDTIRPQKTPFQLKQNASARDFLSLVRKQSRKHEARSTTPEKPVAVEIQSIHSKDQVNKKSKTKEKSKKNIHSVLPVSYASPTPSEASVLIQVPKVLEMKNPKTGIIINRTPKSKESQLPFQNYDPRNLENVLGPGPYEIVSADNRLYVKLKDEENIQKPPEYDTRCAHIYPSKTFLIPTEDEIKKGINAQIIRGTKMTPVEIYCRKTNRRPRSIATIYIAYATFFTKHPRSWDGDVIDRIIDEGEDHWLRCVEYRYKNPKGDFDIMNNLVDKEMTIRICRIVQHKIDLPPNLLKVLTLVLLSYSNIIFLHKDLYLLIIKKTENIFFVFDPNGRTCYRNREVDCGKASLTILQSVEGIIEFIFYTSWRRYPDKYLDQPYYIYAIGIQEANFDSKDYTGPYPFKFKKRYCMVNKYYAFISGTIGIETPEQFHDENSSLVTSLIALIYADLDPPKHWSPRTINALINYGGQYYSALLKSLGSIRIYINDIPKNIVMGAFSAQIITVPYYEVGFIEAKDTTNYRRSPLRMALLKFFRKCSHALLQVDNSSFAIWKDDNFFYVFDPFERQKNGIAFKKNMEEKNNVDCGGGGGLQIHINFESMCRIIYMNAIDTLTLGYFYLHGYELQKINILTGNKYLKASSCAGTSGNYYENLNIFYPNLNPKQNEENSRQKAGGQIEINVPLECLSNLSLRPCQRANSESEFSAKQESVRKRKEQEAEVERSFSIKSLSEENHLSDPDVEIVTELVIQDILSIVDAEIDYYEVKRHFTEIKAKAVLLKSDMPHLNDVVKRIKLGEINNENEERTLSVYSFDSDDMCETSNFKKLINGTGIIIGEAVYCEDSEEEYRSMLLQGVTNAYSALICAGKYKISTWNSEIVSTVIRIGTEIQKHFATGADTINALIKNNFPDITIGCHIMSSTVQMLGIFEIDKISSILEKSFAINDKLLLLFSTFNCAIIKRRKFYYLFFGIPCDEFGFRNMKSFGYSCILKFNDFKSMVDRIIFDLTENSFEKFILISVHPHRSTKDDCAVTTEEMTIARQKFLFQRELNEKKKREAAVSAKIGEIEKIKAIENHRIQTFRKLKAIACENKEDHPACNICQKKYSIITPKLEKPLKRHGKQAKRQSQLKETKPLHAVADGTLTKPTIGFDECPDGKFRVRGNDNLVNRSQSSNINSIRECHLASIYAILQSIVLPIHKWYPTIIDEVIEKSKILYSRIDNKTIRRRRLITNLEVGDFIMDVQISLFSKDCAAAQHINKALCNVLKDRKYFLLQIANATFAVYYDEFFYIFDSYSNEENLNKKNKGKKKQSSAEKCPLSGASWIVFPNQIEFKKYISKISTDKKWFKQFNIYLIDVQKIKENKEKTKLGDLMKYPFKDNDRNDSEPCDKYEWSNIKGENLSWTSPGIPIWSRNNKNRINKFESLDKAFDTQIPEELYSLFGSIHPNAAIFRKSRGKQFMAINILACCIAHLYRVTEWNSYLLDTIVINGDRYFNESCGEIENPDFEMDLEYLNENFIMGEYQFTVNIDKCTCGIFFSKQTNFNFNLSKAMVYFFTNNNRYGILAINGRAIAFGLANKGYFMFDCQSFGQPLFEADQGASYCLLCDTLYRLIYCIILAFNVRKNMEFLIYTVKVNIEGNIKGNQKQSDEKKKKKCIRK